MPGQPGSKRGKRIGAQPVRPDMGLLICLGAPHGPGMPGPYIQTASVQQYSV